MEKSLDLSPRKIAPQSNAPLGKKTDPGVTLRGIFFNQSIPREKNPNFCLSTDLTPYGLKY
jgi:hypothetical protein